jgi:uncharacterized protein (TIGR02145 family)
MTIDYRKSMKSPSKIVLVCYNNNEAYCTTYGRLYDWSTAMNISSSYNSNAYNPSASTKYRGICPTGWHLPNFDEWTTLVDYVSSPEGTKLMATNRWNKYKGTDSYGFSALPSGKSESGGNFNFVGVGEYVSWWSSSENNNNNSYYAYRLLPWSYSNYYGENKSNLSSVRCLQD